VITPLAFAAEDPRPRPQLPEIWSPYAASQLTEIADNLKGALPQSSTLSINPENWYFVK